MWQGKCSNQTLWWTIMAHNNRCSWWLYQICIRTFPFNRGTNYFRLMQNFGIYFRKARIWETKWRDKSIMSPVTHNNTFYNIFIIHFQGFQKGFHGPVWDLGAYEQLQIPLGHLKSESCPELYHFSVWFCQDWQEKNKDQVEETDVPAPFEGKFERLHRAVCGRTASIFWNK